MRAFTFRIDRAPVPWARSRHKGGQHFKPLTLRVYQAEVQLLAKVSGVQKLEGPVSADLDFFLEWPRSSWRKRNPKPAAYLAGKPDLDNLVKAILDALNGIAYADDAQVARISASKHRCKQGDSPCTIVTIRALEEQR